MTTIFKDKSQLKAEILTYAERKDTKVVARLDRFINRAENILDSTLRIPSMERSVGFTLKAGEQSITIPNDYLEMVRIFYADTGEPVYRQSFENLSLNGQVIGNPRAYARSGTDLYFDAMPNRDINLVMVYYQKPVQLLTDNASSVYLELAPYALLYFALSELFKVLGGDEAAEWYGLAVSEVTILNNRADNAEYEGSTLVNTWDNDNDLELYY